MFAVIYKGYVLEDREKDYQKLWKEVAQYFIQHRGALGSCLHKGESGEWVAYSRWPDKATRDSSWTDKLNDTDLNERVKKTVQDLKDCLDPSKPMEEICMTIITDFLVSK